MLVEVFLITFILSAFFSLGGIGSATALIPAMDMLGFGFNFAKAIGLFVNTATTITASIMNIKRKVLDFKFAMPLVFSLAITAPIGAYLSKFIPVEIVKALFALFLLFAGSMIFFSKHEVTKETISPVFLFLLGSIAGIISGLLGLGGGSILLPILMILGFDTKKIAITMSFVIPFSTLGAFITYLSFTKMNWLVLSVAAIAAILGGIVGNYVMHFHLNQKQIKRIIAILMYIIAIKMFYSLTIK